MTFAATCAILAVLFVDQESMGSSNVMHIHILGICGTFMGSLAQLAKAAGHSVSGSDKNVYPPMSTQLERAGIRLVEGYDPRQLEYT